MRRKQKRILPLFPPGATQKKQWTTYRILSSWWGATQSICRTSNRLHSKRLLESFRDPEREASQENSGFVFRLLPRIEDPFGPRQAMSISSPSLEYGKDRRDPAARRPASPL